jgi:hypothetical protein
MKIITTHYIDGAFVESHGSEVMDIISPTYAEVIGRVTLGDEEDTRRAIGAARRAFATFGRTSKEERARVLRRLHQAASARIHDLTAVMVEEYGGVVQFARPIVQTGIDAFLAAEKGLEELPLTRSWGKTTVTLEPVGWPDHRMERQRVIHLPQAGFRRGCRLHGHHQAERDECSSNAGHDRVSDRGSTPKGGLQRRDGAWRRGWRGTRA